MKTALILASLLFTYLGFETYFRLNPRQDFQVNDSYSYIVATPLNPNWIRHDFPVQYDKRGYYRKSEGAIHYFKDQFGARWINQHPRKLRTKPVLVFGDSVTYGFGVRAEDTFSQQLEEKFKADFLNLAAPGADSGRALADYTKFGQMPHRLVVYGLHLNDLIDFTTNFVAENQLLGNSFVRHSKFADFLARRWDRAFGRMQRIHAITSSAVFETPIFQGNFAAIVKLNTLAKQRKVPLVVAVLPTLIDLKSKTLTPVYAEIMRRLKEQEIETVDLTQGLNTYQDDDLWILPFDQHPNEIAHGIFAEKLALYFKNKNPLR